MRDDIEVGTPVCFGNPIVGSKGRVTAIDGRHITVMWHYGMDALGNPWTATTEYYKGSYDLVRVDEELYNKHIRCDAFSDKQKGYDRMMAAEIEARS